MRVHFCFGDFCFGDSAFVISAFIPVSFRQLCCQISGSGADSTASGAALFAERGHKRLIFRRLRGEQSVATGVQWFVQAVHLLPGEIRPANFDG